MADEKEPQQGRQLKIKGMDGEETTEKGKKKEKKEKESKLWVLLILGITILVSLIFSARAENGWLSQIGKRERSTKIQTEQVEQEVRPKGSSDWFGPAVYEFE